MRLRLLPVRCGVRFWPWNAAMASWGLEGVRSPGVALEAIDPRRYYLKYQNRRPEYVKAFWDVVNWNQVSKWYDDALAGKAPQF